MFGVSIIPRDGHSRELSKPEPPQAKRIAASGIGSVRTLAVESRRSLPPRMTGASWPCDVAGLGRLWKFHAAGTVVAY